jgi:hypothetical protein
MKVDGQHITGSVYQFEMILMTKSHSSVTFLIFLSERNYFALLI